MALFPPSRHLPMVAGLLHSRIHLNLREFRQQNHMTFFSNVLAILELLQPLVFHGDHQGALQDCLLSFMKVLQVGISGCQARSDAGFRLGTCCKYGQIPSLTWVLISVLVELPEVSLAAGVHQ